MTQLRTLVGRNVRLFFRDRGMFFSSLITPVILLVLYATFLARVYRDSLQSSLGDFLNVPEKLMDGFVGGQLVSSILAVSCITVAFCSNMVMVQDKAKGVVRDFVVSPVSPPIRALGYYIASLIASTAVCYTACAVCLGYLAWVGWYMSVWDVLLMLLDVFILSVFGTAISSVLNFFLKTEAQISAVGTVVSAGYGFISGAYMPIASYAGALRKILSFLPGTYGTSLLKNHALRGVYAEMCELGFSNEALNSIRDSVDCNVYFFENKVKIPEMYGIVVGATAVFLGIYIFLNALFEKKNDR